MRVISVLPLLAAAVVAVVAVVAAVVGCTPSSPSKAAEERYVGTGKGGIEDVKWGDVETDFVRAASPGSLTFVELSGAHCGGCKKNLKLFEKLAQVRKDIAFRIVPFPDELCPPHATDEQRAQCRQLEDLVKQEGMCFTPTVWAIAPNGTLLARDDTCAGKRPASDLLHQIADRELARL